MKEITARKEPISKTLPTAAQKQEAEKWFHTLRDQICAAFEKLENDLQGTPHAPLAPGRFERKTWKRPVDDGQDGGGGDIRMASVLPPVLRPNIVPRSYRRLNST